MSTPELEPAEVVRLSAVDTLFFGHYFFPKAFRQASPEFHRTAIELAQSRRYAALKMFRGSSKTTLMRVLLAKDVSFADARTVMFVGLSQDHAKASLNWLRTNIEYNKRWSQFFGLVPSKPWSDQEFVVENTRIIDPLTGKPTRITVTAYGITGSLRGVNKEDYRPDRILVDDPCNEENTATPQARQKTRELFFSTIKESLAPVADAPLARLTLAQTPLHPEDLVSLCEKSGEFGTFSVGCLTSTDKATGRSTWEERFPTATLFQEMDDAVKLNQLSLWMREKMVTITSPETSLFMASWLRDWSVVPEGARYVMAVDPAPVLSDVQRAQRGGKTDPQAVMVCAYYQGKKFIVEYAEARDQDPEALAGHLDRMARKYPVLRLGVETVAYQATLKWFLEREMRAGRLKHLRIVELKTTKNKRDRIIQAHTGRASSGSLFVPQGDIDFKAQFELYPNVPHDDLLDASAMCDAVFAEENQFSDYNGDVVDLGDYKERLALANGCP